jgi:uncharacterized heparinase superfamily protein
MMNQFIEIFGIGFVQNFIRKSRMYGFSLLGKSPEIIHNVSLSLWQGSTDLGKSLVYGEYIVQGEFFPIIELKNCLANPDAFSDYIVTCVHSFEWLKDLKNVGDNASRKLARNLIEHWIHHNHSWKNKCWTWSSWKADVTGYRLSNLLSLYDFFGASADEDFNAALATSIFRQYKHLEKDVLLIKRPAERFKALKGLVFIAAAYNHRQKLDIFLDQMSKSVSAILLKDGGHSSGCPKLQYLFLRDLIDIRTVLKSINQEEPSFLHEAVVKSTPVLRFFRHGDGNLTKFKGNINQRDLGFCPEVLESQMVDSVLSLADVSGRPANTLDDMGYARLLNKSGLSIINLQTRFNSSGHPALEPGLGVLDFEWSYGAHRLIESADIIIQKHDHSWVTPSRENSNFIYNRLSRQGNLIFLGDFDDRIEKMTYRHQRQLFLSASGIDFRGQDTLTISQDALVGIRFVLCKNVVLEEHTHDAQQRFLISIKDPKKNSNNQLSWSFLYSDCDDALFVPPEPDQKIPGFIMFLKKFNNFLPWTFKWALRLENRGTESL